MRDIILLGFLALMLCAAPALADSMDDKMLAEWIAAAERGDPKMQVGLGSSYYTGLLSPKDDAEAVKWWRRAAEQGNADAQSLLGRAYEKGEGVKQDDIEAANWYRKAAEQGNATGQFNLGSMYFAGTGVPKDWIYAYMWFSLAEVHGLKQAAAQRKATEIQLSPELISEGQRRAQEWLRQHKATSR